MEYLTTNQVAKELKVSRRRVIQLIEEGKLKADRLGWSYAISKKELERYKKELEDDKQPMDDTSL